MLYRELKPSSAAAQFVKCFWMLEDATPSSDIQRIFPDGRGELIFNLAEPFEVCAATGWERQPQAFVVGQITGPMILRARGKSKIFGIRFHPHGTKFLGVPGAELTGQQVPLEQLTRALAVRLQQVRDERDRGIESMTAIVDAFARDIEADAQIAYAVAQFERSMGAISVPEMSRRLGLSPRQFERRFKAAVGVGPKLFCRIQRFQSVLQAMESPDNNWVNAAIDCGYYDQAHLIRDFQQFAGTAPTALLTQEIHLAKRFAS